MKTFAIIGAGYAGLATTWELLQQTPKNSISITLFDPGGIGGGASGISAGLLHCYTGKEAIKDLNGEPGLQATKTLLFEASKYSNKRIYNDLGVLRIATTEEQKVSFAKSKELNPDISWSDTLLGKFPGITISSGMTVYPKEYLKGLWRACQEKGATLKQQGISQLIELKEFDCVIVTAGHSTNKFPELAYLPLRPVKGQILELEWPKNVEPITQSINSKGYLIPLKYKNTNFEQVNKYKCLVGATFEKEFDDARPNRKLAQEKILPNITPIFPELAKAPILDCRAGIRSYAPNRLPFVKQINAKLWVNTGYGSKGLLYHALYSKNLVTKILF